MEKLKNKQGYVFGILASITFAAYVLVNRYVYITYKVEVLDYTATFLVVGGVFALTARLASGKGALSEMFTPSAWRVGLNGILAGIAMGVFLFGQGYTTAVNASILATSTIITTAVFSRFLLKNILSKLQLMWFIVMFVGLYIAIVGFHNISLNKGDIIVLTSSLLFGFTNTFSKSLMKTHTSGFVSDVRLISGGALFIVVGLLLSGTDFLVVNAGLWPLLAGFLFWLTIRFFYASVHHINPNQAIVLANSHPTFTPIAGVFLLSEPYGWTKFIGAVLLVTSIYFINKQK